MELGLQQDPGGSFDFSFKNCLLQFDDVNGLFTEDPLFDFEDLDKYSNMIYNQTPDFLLPSKNQFQIGPSSAALDAAEPNIVPSIPMDILGIDRTSNPDIGAYEFVPENWKIIEKSCANYEKTPDFEENPQFF